MKQNILVLCTGNSCRSQIAEGYLRHFIGDKAQVYSAGIETHGVNPRAIETMRKDGIDISSHTSNHIDEYASISFDFVITVCDNAQEQCPVYSGPIRVTHHNFPDPAKARGSESQIQQHFDEVRDQIKEFCRQWAHSF